MSEPLKVERAYQDEKFIGFRLTIPTERTFLIWADQSLPGLRVNDGFVASFGKEICYVECYLGDPVRHLECEMDVSDVTPAACDADGPPSYEERFVEAEKVIAQLRAIINSQRRKERTDIPDVTGGQVPNAETLLTEARKRLAAIDREASRLLIGEIDVLLKSNAVYRETISDGYTDYVKCGRSDCGLEVVRPGKTQCWCDEPESMRHQLEIAQANERNLIHVLVDVLNHSAVKALNGPEDIKIIYARRVMGMPDEGLPLGINFNPAVVVASTPLGPVAVNSVETVTTNDEFVAAARSALVGAVAADERKEEK